MGVATNIHDGWDNTITPDGGKLMVGQGYAFNISPEIETTIKEK